MARRKTPSAVEVAEEFTPEAEQTITEIHQTGATIIAAAMDDQQKAAAAVNQRIGRRQMMAVMSKLVTVTDLVDLKNIKESKAYKNHTTKDMDGNTVTITTWDEYCRVIEGRSRESVDLDLKNLANLGPELFESMRTVGIGPSTMRAIRQLPEDDQQLIQQAVNTTDKDDLAEFVEQLITKNSKEKADLSKKLDDAKADLEAKDAVAETNAKRINELQEQVARIKKLPPDELDVQMRSEISKLVNDIDHDVRVNLFNGISELINHAQEHDLAPDDFIRAQIEQLESVVAFLRENLVIGVEWESKGE